MNLKDKLEALYSYIKVNPEYKLPPNLSTSIRYISVVLAKPKSQSYEAILCFSRSNGTLLTNYFYRRANEVVIEYALQSLLYNPYISWKEEGFDKYWLPILEEQFSELSPIEQTKISNLIPHN